MRAARRRRGRLLAAAATALALGLPRCRAGDWAHSASGRGGWGALCYGNDDQSPIDIEPIAVEDSDAQVRLQYRPWALKDVKATVSEDGRVSRLVFNEGRSPGYVQVGTAFDDFDEYELRSVEVHSPSEHTFRHATWPVELQLWHEPRSLHLIRALKQDASRLSNRSAQATQRLDAIEAIDTELRSQLSGEAEPWTSMGPLATGARAWIDDTRGRAESAVEELRGEALADCDAASRMVDAARKILRFQSRQYASHQVVISLLFLRSTHEKSDTGARGLTAGSLLAGWVSQALAGGEANAHGDTQTYPDGMLDVAAALGTRGRKLYAYMGSLTRPPCTPRVRWFVTAQPLSALQEDLERLLAAAGALGRPTGAKGEVDAASDGDGGGGHPARAMPWTPVSAGRGVQPLGHRKLMNVALSGDAFLPPAVPLPDMVSKPSQKWALVQRYGKVFLLCAGCLIATPLLFVCLRACTAEMDRADSMEEMEESLDFGN